jgi:hypothetical protein
METCSAINLSERSIKPTFQGNSNEIDYSTTSAIKQLKQDDLKEEKPNQRLVSYNLYDPYTQMMKPTSIEKIRRNKLEILKRKKIIISNASNDNIM